MNNFTPAPDEIIKECGAMAALVWGRMWRYSQGSDGVCWASHSTIAKDLNVGRDTVFRHIKTLIDNGYIQDTTAEAVGKSHRYLVIEPVLKSYRSSDNLSENHTPPALKSDSNLYEINTQRKKVKKESNISSTTSRSLPQTIKQAEKNKYIAVYRNVTGILPGSANWSTIIEAISYLETQHQDVEKYLTPFWLAWSSRKRKSDGKPYDKFNLTWLTEWAIGGEIPQQVTANAKRSNGSKPERKEPSAEEVALLKEQLGI